MEEPLVHAQLAVGEPADVDQPGLARLRAAWANRARRATHEVTEGLALRQDGVAGLNSALASVPDGMACGLLAGVNPIHGLYACIAGPIVGGLTTGSQLMVITTTSAAALGTGEALEHLPFEARAGALVVLVVLIGLFQLLFGLLRLGRVTRFVSYSVMTGFVTGIASRTILTQVDTVTGLQSTGPNIVVRVFNALVDFRRFDLPTLSTAALAFVLIGLMQRTKIGSIGTVLAVAIPSLLVLLLGLNSVQVVRDVGEIAQGLPRFLLPRPADFSVEILTSAVAIALVILVQGAGVSQSVPNPDGRSRDASRDFIAQGAANLVSGFFRGLPVGGSLSSTALSVTAGARSRWAAVFAGLIVLSVVVVFSEPVSRIAMPALAALLIYASSRVIKPSRLRSVWAAGTPSIVTCGATFLATLIMPIQYAVSIGVVLSAVLYVYTSAGDVSVVELIEGQNGEIEEVPLDRDLRSGAVTVLDVYGSLFYAGARTLERQLPRPAGSHNAQVILNLRGRKSLGSTLVAVLAGYAEKLRAAEGRLYLSGLTASAMRELVNSRKLDLGGPVRAFESTTVRGQSTRAARAEAEAWLVGAAAAR